MLTYQEGPDQTRLELDVNGDSVADGVILLSGDQTGFINFAL